MSKDIAELKPVVRMLAQDLCAACRSVGINLTITCTYRNGAEQERLYAQGRTAPGPIVTNAKANQSLHQFRVAFDVAPLDTHGNINWNGDFAAIGRIGKKVGLEWGGDWAGFKDIAHFQYLAGYSLADFQKGLVDWTKFEIKTEIAATPPPPPASLAVNPERETLTPEEADWFLATLKWIGNMLAKLKPGYNRGNGGV